MAFAVSASAVGRVAFLGANSGLKSSTPSGPRSTGRGGVVTTRAFFNFGGVKQPKGVAMVCRDCGYVYRGMDFNDLPKDYKCPPVRLGEERVPPGEEGGLREGRVQRYRRARGEEGEPAGVPREARGGEEEGGGGGAQEALIEMSAFEYREARKAYAVIRATRQDGETRRRDARGRDGKRSGRAACDRRPVSGPITEGCLSIKTMAIVATPSESKFNRLFTHSQPSDTVRDVLFATAPSRFRVTLP